MHNPQIAIASVSFTGFSSDVIGHTAGTVLYQGRWQKQFTNSTTPIT